MMLVDRIDNIPQGLFHGSAGTCLVAGLSDTGPRSCGRLEDGAARP